MRCLEHWNWGLQASPGDDCPFALVLIEEVVAQADKCSEPLGHNSESFLDHDRDSYLSKAIISYIKCSRKVASLQTRASITLKIANAKAYLACNGPLEASKVPLDSNAEAWLGTLDLSLDPFQAAHTGAYAEEDPHADFAGVAADEN